MKIRFTGKYTILTITFPKSIFKKNKQSKLDRIAIKYTVIAEMKMNKANDYFNR